MTDYISRDAALDALCKACTPCFSSTGKPILAFDVDYVPAINAIPAADVRPVVRGKWIDRDDDYYGWNMWACSACGEEFVLTDGTPDMNEYHFCPNCGARMEES